MAEAERIAKLLTKAQARAVLFLATDDQWHKPSRSTFSSASADCLIHASPVVEWTFSLSGGRMFRITKLGRAVAIALRAALNTGEPDA